ncbi:MAG: hypothetical protein IPO25_02385 [Saprospiraceae bacterium]|nr:hypothetical protein [Saprospiraceae bacterium]
MDPKVKYEVDDKTQSTRVVQLDSYRWSSFLDNTNNAPLPRREYTPWSDYNITELFSTI